MGWYALYDNLWDRLNTPLPRKRLRLPSIDHQAAGIHDRSWLPWRRPSETMGSSSDELATRPRPRCGVGPLQGSFFGCVSCFRCLVIYLMSLDKRKTLSETTVLSAFACCAHVGFLLAVLHSEHSQDPWSWRRLSKYGAPVVFWKVCVPTISTNHFNKLRQTNSNKYLKHIWGNISFTALNPVDCLWAFLTSPPDSSTHRRIPPSASRKRPSARSAQAAPSWRWIFCCGRRVWQHLQVKKIDLITLYYTYLYNNVYSGLINMSTPTKLIRNQSKQSVIRNNP